MVVRSSTRKKLVIIIWHLGIGGMQKRMRDVVREMAQKYPEWQVVFLVKYQKESLVADDLAKSGAEVRYFSRSRFWANSVFSIFWLLAELRKIQPEVCLTFLDHLSVITVIIKRVWLGKMRVVLNESMLTTAYLKMERGWMAPLWHWLIRVTYPGADLIIVPTKAGERDLADNFGVPENKIRVIPNWTMWAAAKGVKKKYDGIFVGRLEWEKGVKELIKMLQILKEKRPGFRMAVVGGGKQKEWFLGKIKTGRLEGMVDFRGLSTDVKKYILSAKMLVLPTLNEGMPNVVLEAAMCQVPVVTNNVPGVEEIVENGRTGYITDDPQEMAERVISLSDNEEERKKMGKAAQAEVKNNFSGAKQGLFIKTLLNEK